MQIRAFLTKIALTNEWVRRGMKERPKEMETLFKMNGQQSGTT